MDTATEIERVHFFPVDWTDAERAAYCERMGYRYGVEVEDHLKPPHARKTDVQFFSDLPE